jgi:hypothetical protein
MPDRDMAADLAAAERFLASDATALDAIRALEAGGFADVAAALREMERQRDLGDYLQPAAVLTIPNEPNDYQGPGTGYRPEGDRWREICDLPQAWDPHNFGAPAEAPPFPWAEDGEAPAGESAEVVIALGPALGSRLHYTVNGLPLLQVLARLLEGVADAGVPARVVRIVHTSDLGQMGFAASHLSGSGIAVAVQSKGTTVIHRRGLLPLNNLELFSQASQLTLDHYRRIGENAAGYALGRPVEPLLVPVDNMARLKYIVQTTILHRHETDCVRAGHAPVLLRPL